MTVAEVDRLVVQDDAVAARVWPRLGPKVRAAYLEDRDAWVVLRRRVDAGRPVSPAALAAKHAAFAGWARAFHAAGGKRRHPSTAVSPAAVAPAAPAAAPPAADAAPSANVAPAAPAPPAAAPSLAVLGKPTSGAGAAVAGGLVLAGLIAVAARRRRA